MPCQELCFIFYLFTQLGFLTLSDILPIELRVLQVYFIISIRPGQCSLGGEASPITVVRLNPAYYYHTALTLVMGNTIPTSPQGIFPVFIAKRLWVHWDSNPHPLVLEEYALMARPSWHGLTLFYGQCLIIWNKVLDSNRLFCSRKTFIGLFQRR